MKSLFGSRMKKSPSWLGECRWVLRNPVSLSLGSQYLCCWCCALSRLSPLPPILPSPPRKTLGSNYRGGMVTKNHGSWNSKNDSKLKHEARRVHCDWHWAWNFGHAHGHTSSSRTTFQVLNLLCLHLQLGTKHLRLWEYSRWNHNTSYLHLQIWLITLVSLLFVGIQNKYLHQSLWIKGSYWNWRKFLEITLIYAILKKNILWAILLSLRNRRI